MITEDELDRTFGASGGEGRVPDMVSTSDIEAT
jgi:hypothetical protein